MTELALVTSPSRSAELVGLARQAASEHQAACEAVETAFVHALRAGEALLAAKEMLAAGALRPWLREVGISDKTANHYMRLAYYKDRFTDLDSGHMSVSRAMLYLRGLPAIGQSVAADEQRQDEIRRLSKAGVSQRSIARELSISRTQVRFALGIHPASKEAAKRRKMERRRELREASRRAAVEAAARARGGNVKTAYGLLRKLQLELHGAIESSETASERQAIRDALTSAYDVEDAIGRGLRPDVCTRKLRRTG